MDRMLLVLRRSPEQETALQALLDQQHDKSSANYHRWLIPDEFGQQFGPADQDMQTVTLWLVSHGFQVARVSRGRTVIEFSGTAAQVREAFRAEIHDYLAGGAAHWANATDPQIPTALTPVVSGIASLNNFPVRPLLHVAGAFSKSVGTGKVTALGSRLLANGVPSTSARPQFTFTDSTCQPECYALGPYDFATIYNVLPLWNSNPAIDGTGQSIAIVGESNINPQDVRDFRSMFGLPANDPQVIVDGPDPGLTQNDTETEALLDVEWSGAVAPKAAITFVTSASTNTAAGVNLSALYAVDNNVAPVLSVSFGLCELFLGTTGNAFHNTLWEQAAAEGITVLVAAGDSGSAGCDLFNGLVTPEPAQLGLAVSGWASTPFNVAVGGTDFLNFGTSFEVNSPSPYWNSTNNTQAGGLGLSAKGYVPESTWNDSCTTEGLSFLGFESTAEARCNDSTSRPMVITQGGGGGRSNCTASNGISRNTCSGGYASPPWQTNGLKDTVRDVPDVSLFASDGFWGSFYIVCEADALLLHPSCNLNNGLANFLGVGGTSAAAPAFAGMMALVNQFTNSKTGQGNANYELYKLASLLSQSGLNCNSTTGPTSGCIFNDVTFGTIAMPCAANSTSDCKVATGGDSFGVLSGYGTGTGYDLATGLGSVNAFNLVHNWNNVTFNSTTTTLTLDNVSSGTDTRNIPHGSAVPVTVTVTSAKGTPTGDVSLIANSADGQGVDGNTLSAGTVTWQTTQLPGGSYSVHAHYAGDGTFGASDSGAIGVTVTPEASAISLSGLTFAGGQLVPVPPSVPYGTTVYLRSDVGSATNATGSVPTGTVTFTDNNSGSQAYPLNSEGSAIAGNGLCTLAPGSHSFTASYSGDNSYQKSGPTSPPIAFGVTQVTPQITTVPSQIAGAVNSTIGMAVLVGGNINFNPQTGMLCSPAPPSGTVSLLNGTTQIASSTITTGIGNSSKLGQAIVIIQFSAAALPFGQSNVTVKYSGDANYSPATSTVLVQVGFATTTTVTSPNSSVAPGAIMTFTAQVTSSQSGGPPITGSVVFQVDAGAGTTVPLVNGSAQFTTSFPSGVPNSHKITARYSGDQNYIPSRGTLQEAVVVPDFTLSDNIGNGGSVVIAAPGNSSAPITLTISGTSDYNGTITFGPSSCAITPAGSLSSCSFTPSSITGSGSTQLVITTTAAHTAATPTARLDLDGKKLPPIGFCVLFLVTLVIFKRERRLSIAFSCVVLVALFGLWACSGGSNGSSSSSTTTIPGTPTGVMYTATINAAPAGSNAHSINVPFVVR
jgi:hypothetical protein